MVVLSLRSLGHGLRCVNSRWEVLGGPVAGGNGCVGAGAYHSSLSLPWECGPGFVAPPFLSYS